MSTDYISFFTIALIAFTLAVCLVIVVIAYAKTLHKLHHAQKHRDNVDEYMEKKAMHVVANARGNAFKIIEQANQKATEIIGKAKTFREASKDAFSAEVEGVTKAQEDALQKTSQELLAVYQKMLEELKQKNIGIFKNISKNIEDNASLVVNDLRDILQKETLSAQKILEEKVEKEYEKVRGEIARYRDDRIKQIDQRIYEILQSVSKKVIGKTLRFDDHERLVTEALEQAKKEHVI